MTDLALEVIWVTSVPMEKVEFLKAKFIVSHPLLSLLVYLVGISQNGTGNPILS